MTGTKIMIAPAMLPVLLLALLLSLALIPARGGAQNQPQNPPAAAAQDSSTQANGKVVYVCACLKTKSCSCFTEAKTEGPCSCGTEGGRPLKAVPQNGPWAKANRDALAH